MSPIHTNTRILIVDDTPENLAVLGDVLQPDYTVQATTSGERALAIAAAKPAPDLILLDIMMPGMDGYTVLGRLRQNPATRDIPVVFLTALTDTQDEEHGLALGAVDYITKPIRPALVLARVRTHVRRDREHRGGLRHATAHLARRALDPHLDEAQPVGPALPEPGQQELVGLVAAGVGAEVGRAALQPGDREHQTWRQRDGGGRCLR
ncbi:MAG TPA: response regulator, partial [Denitromonas sp.]|nr:response regulator [Denitromonas sp.]